VLASDPRVPGGTRVSLWCDASAGVPRRGSCIEALAMVRAPKPLTTPGGFDEAGWLANRGASLTARVEGAAWTEIRGPPLSLAVYLARARAAWSSRLAERVPGEAGEFMRGLLLGERSRVTPETVDALRRAGALHLLALSGQHVLLVAALLQGLAAMARAGPKNGAWCALLGVWIYSLLTGASPSVVRAAAAVTWSAWGRALAAGSRAPTASPGGRRCRYWWRLGSPSMSAISSRLWRAPGYGRPAARGASGGHLMGRARGGRA